MKRSKRSERVEGLSLRERVGRVLEMPPDLFPGGSLIEIRGRGEMTVRGNGSILVYTPEQICVALSDGVLSVKGQALVCTSYYVGALGIEGRIDEVAFGETVTCMRGEEKE
jgi:sporulation protein YqfC